MSRLPLITLFLPLLAPAWAAANEGPCRVTFDTIEITTDFVAGKGGDAPQPETLHLRTVRAEPEPGAGPLANCDRFSRERVQIGSWKERLPEALTAEIEAGAGVSGTIWYQARIPGKYLQPQYRYVMRIDTGRDPVLVQGMYVSR